MRHDRRVDLSHFMMMAGFILGLATIFATTVAR